MYLCWFDNDKKRPIAEKIAAGVARYTEKFGKAPTCCLINPSDATACVHEARSLTVQLVPRKEVGLSCFWIGEDDV